ncbi:MAG: hypothetical protein AAGI63_08640 [Planctomycetota bacterium]
MGDQTIVAIQSAPQPKFTGELIRLFAGGVRSVTDGIRNQLGMRFPGLERKPPLLAITDPANLSESASPAVSAAAKVKADEDKARQKIKALRYLGTKGCGGCYKEVENGLLEALKDCTEEVRYEAIIAMRSTVGNPCQYCKADACCSPKVRKALKEIAFNLDPSGCFVESSERVRRQARLALAGCGGAGPEEIEELPIEGPEEVPTPAPQPAAPDGGASFAQASGSPAVESTTLPASGADSIQTATGGSETAGVTVQTASTDGGNDEAVRQATWQPGDPASAVQVAASTTPPNATTPPVAQASGSVNSANATVIPAAVTNAPKAEQKQLFVAWEQIQVDPREFDSPERARQVILYLRARARGIEMAPPQFQADEVTVERFKPTAIEEVEWDTARRYLRKLPTGGVSPILMKENQWFVLRQLTRYEK